MLFIFNLNEFIMIVDALLANIEMRHYILIFTIFSCLGISHWTVLHLTNNYHKKVMIFKLAAAELIELISSQLVLPSLHKTCVQK